MTADERRKCSVLLKVLIIEHLQATDSELTVREFVEQVCQEAEQKGATP